MRTSVPAPVIVICAVSLAAEPATVAVVELHQARRLVAARVHYGAGGHHRPRRAPVADRQALVVAADRRPGTHAGDRPRPLADAVLPKVERLASSRTTRRRPPATRSAAPPTHTRGAPENLRVAETERVAARCRRRAVLSPSRPQRKQSAATLSAAPPSVAPSWGPSLGASAAPAPARTARRRGRRHHQVFHAWRAPGHSREESRAAAPGPAKRRDRWKRRRPPPAHAASPRRTQGAAGRRNAATRPGPSASGESPAALAAPINSPPMLTLAKVEPREPGADGVAGLAANGRLPLEAA